MKLYIYLKEKCNICIYIFKQNTGAEKQAHVHII